MNVIARTIAATMLALALGMWGAAGAGAHTTLAGSDPADGASLPTAPRTVTLTFSEDINPAFANIAVSAADGANRVSGPAKVDGPRLSAPVDADLPGGEYTIGYRVVSADGHPVTGSIRFTVAAAPGAPTASAAPAPAPESAPADETGPLGADSTTSILAAGAAGLLLAGGIVFWQSRKRRGGDEPPNP
ncbi:copper resistance CopC family protein [Mycolicibacterium sediminis]|uniref:CopC domain-containing protein n=1 Tax=Mycolicibacterium sediminis TaxID=1286180 RepID=A0A7I7QSI1_9MYCO|nr:copper resistance CopC family protein [Mycolicibacterium sediminis]BBY29264.1 hypothetical protein MSEDJ_33600 [Mycolicibacterium sediminis]